MARVAQSKHSTSRYPAPSTASQLFFAKSSDCFAVLFYANNKPQRYDKIMKQGFISGKKSLAAFLDCGLNKVETLLDAGLPKLYNGNSFVFNCDKVAAWYEDYLNREFPMFEPEKYKMLKHK